MVKVILAGYNVDADLIKEAQKGKDFPVMTPETISAAYARISRDPASIQKLRASARKEIEEARKSNKAIIFKMGHNTIAEHGIFNFDILGLSRYAVEFFEEMRLASYTEKSQRYITLKGDYVTPKEIKNSKHLDLFHQTVKLQNDFYLNNLEKVINFMFEKNPELAKDPKNKGTLEGLAKEDLRYVLGLATKAQIGATVNARSLEYRIRKLASYPLTEARELAKKLFDAVDGIAPSMIKYTEKTDYLEKTRPELREASQKLELDSKKSLHGEASITDVELVGSSPEGDNKLISALLFTGLDRNFKECKRTVGNMSYEEKKEFLENAFRHIKSYDQVLREFEFPDLTYQIEISATGFAQLKRHRMATIVTQDYNPKLGYTIPRSIKEIGLEKGMIKIMDKSTEAFNKVTKDLPCAKYYFLTNGHKRRVLLKVNARELYHISRLREDHHAQWDIKDKAHKMIKIGKENMPLTFMLAAGKDTFEEAYRNVFSK